MPKPENEVRYVATPGKVWDYKEPRYKTDEEDNEVQDHLYAMIVWIKDKDSIDNYVEVDIPKKREESQ